MITNVKADEAFINRFIGQTPALRVLRRPNLHIRRNVDCTITIRYPVKLRAIVSAVFTARVTGGMDEHKIMRKLNCTLQEVNQANDIIDDLEIQFYRNKKAQIH